MTIQVLQARWSSLDVGISSTVAAVRAFVRGIPLFWSDRPGTPLRVFCLMALDLLHRIRHARPLPQSTLRLLALLLDCGACANAAFDRKAHCRQERRRTLRLLSESGIRSPVIEYLRRLKEIERKRPLPGGDRRQFENVRLYREAVVRLAIGMLATTADGNIPLEEGIRATECDPEFNLLFRLAMLCQVIDDVVDYSRDLAAGLPGFLTATKSLREALELTGAVTSEYADDYELAGTSRALPLRCALVLVSISARAVVALSGPFQMFGQGFQISASTGSPPHP